MMRITGATRTMCLLVQRPFFHCGGYVCPDLEEKLLPRRELHDDARAWADSPRTGGVWRDVPASCHSVSLSLSLSGHRNRRTVIIKSGIGVCRPMFGLAMQKQQQ